MEVFSNDIDRCYYLRMMREYCGKYSVSVMAWCLMPNHVHIIAVPEKETSLADAIGNAHQAYTAVFNSIRGDSGRLFQGRFYSTPLDRAHLYSAVRYVLRNPVRAGIVDDPYSYPWSSTLFNSGRIDRDPLVTSNEWIDWIGHWDDYLAGDPLDIEEIRCCTRTGRPCGDDRFIGYAERVTGRDLRKRKPGPTPSSDDVSL